ncbi:putative Protein-tyrosine-phosphatase MKP1 [Blattamonas nauphoetae]|uniref:Protein-tyrosine-phosphatase n=1 Tax=Blattamonas nauphoetae TaxID=2049346 RepID=A0ABQ9YKH3_9EUKA|nr:putative Protein-tyrosine-phosphatase MKP1 [Blattamonas nauphoetae]
MQVPDPGAKKPPLPDGEKPTPAYLLNRPKLKSRLSFKTLTLDVDPSNDQPKVNTEEEYKRNKLAYFDEDCSCILPHLYLGSKTVAGNLLVLNSCGITHILNLTGPVYPNYFPDQFKYVNLNLTDDPSEDLLTLFPLTLHIIEQARTTNGKILVHCHQGVSRAASVVISYVMWYCKFDFETSLRSVRRIRQIVRPNYGFISQLSDWEHEIRNGPSNVVYRMGADRTNGFVIIPHLVDGPYSVNTFDVRLSYILWTSDRVYTWHGKESSEMMRAQSESFGLTLSTHLTPPPDVTPVDLISNEDLPEPDSFVVPVITTDPSPLYPCTLNTSLTVPFRTFTQNESGEFLFWTHLQRVQQEKSTTPILTSKINGFAFDSSQLHRHDEFDDEVSSLLKETPWLISQDQPITSSSRSPTQEHSFSFQPTTPLDHSFQSPEHGVHSPNFFSTPQHLSATSDRCDKTKLTPLPTLELKYLKPVDSELITHTRRKELSRSVDQTKTRARNLRTRRPTAPSQQKRAFLTTAKTKPGKSSHWNEAKLFEYPSFNEVFMFDSTDLWSDRCYVLDPARNQTQPVVFVWIGTDFTINKEKAPSLSSLDLRGWSRRVAQSYFQARTKRRQSAKFILHVEMEGQESDIFWSYFTDG